MEITLNIYEFAAWMVLMFLTGIGFAALGIIWLAVKDDTFTLKENVTGPIIKKGWSSND